MVVTSMTFFCGGCNRLRVMADGNLKVCLFGEAERRCAAMRAGSDDAALMETVSAAVKRKAAAHAGMRPTHEEQVYDQNRRLMWETCWARANGGERAGGGLGTKKKQPRR